MTVKEQLEQELTQLKNEYTALTIEIPRDETYTQQLNRHLLNGRIAGIKYALGVIETSTEKTYADGFQDGGDYVLSNLADLYDGVMDTDIWAEFAEETAPRGYTNSEESLVSLSSWVADRNEETN